MNILGIDGGLGGDGSPTAAVLLRDNGGEFDVLQRKEFTSTRGDWQARMDSITSQFDTWLLTYGTRIDVVGIEDVYYANGNPQTMKKLALLVGSLRAIALHKHCIAPVHLVSNAEATLAYVGHTCKAEAVQTLANRIETVQEPLSEHEAMALAVAVATATREKQKRIRAEVV